MILGKLTYGSGVVRSIDNKKYALKEIQIMHTVRQILRSKENHIQTIEPQETAFYALQQMAEYNIGALLVVEKEKLVGVFSERDYARKITLKGKSSKDTFVRDIMTREVLYIEQSASINDCMALMTDKRVRHLPVLEENKLVGIVSIGDVVKQIISDQEFTIRQLEKYISGAY